MLNEMPETGGWRIFARYLIMYRGGGGIGVRRQRIEQMIFVS